MAISYPLSDVTDCKMSDLEWPWVAILCFRLAVSDSERLTFKNNCVKSNKHIPMLHGRSGATGLPPKWGGIPVGSHKAHKSRDFPCFLTVTYDVSSHWAAVNSCHARKSPDRPCWGQPAHIRPWNYFRRIPTYVSTIPVSKRNRQTLYCGNTAIYAGLHNEFWIK